MAYMTKDGKGPYPNKAGEYCGNHLVGSSPIPTSHQSPKEAKQQLERYLNRMRFGKPHSCPAGTTEEMKNRGYVGLYLKENSFSGSMDGDYEVPTPYKLMEPDEK